MSEATLDPAGPEEWSEFRGLAHRMLDDMLDHLAGLPQEPAWRPIPPDIRSSFHQLLPREGMGAA
ncbi:MAG TPA: hypothetical protein VIG95_11330, partial [Gemmatimonadales bacterium]